jgi:hypothetical protein
MFLAMKEPAELARRAEDSPQLPAASCERVSGYGVMGLPCRSGHVLGLRRWTASSVGEPSTSIWHRNSAGRWTFHETVRSEIACTRYFGVEVERVQVGPGPKISITRESSPPQGLQATVLGCRSHRRPRLTPLSSGASEGRVGVTATDRRRRVG